MLSKAQRITAKDALNHTYFLPILDMVEKKPNAKQITLENDIKKK